MQLLLLVVLLTSPPFSVSADPVTRPSSRPADAADSPKLPTKAIGVPLNFNGVPFADTVAFAKAITNFSIEVDENALKAAGMDPDKVRLTEINLALGQNVSLGKVLELTAAQVDGRMRVYVDRDGRIIYTSQAYLDTHRGRIADDPDAAIKARAERKAKKKPSEPV